jgi:hypothetical protein
MKKSKEYNEGAKAYEDNKHLTNDNPYEHGTQQWQAWINGHCDQGDKDFITLVKARPDLLIDK